MPLLHCAALHCTMPGEYIMIYPSEGGMQLPYIQPNAALVCRAFPGYVAGALALLRHLHTPQLSDVARRSAGAIAALVVFLVLVRYMDVLCAHLPNAGKLMRPWLRPS
jgi:hypothetical protein